MKKGADGRKRKTRGRGMSEDGEARRHAESLPLATLFEIEETMGEMLKLVQEGRFDAADAYLASVVRLRHEQRKNGVGR